MYMARQLSFSGVNFDVREVKLCATFIEMYDAAVTLVRDLLLKIEKSDQMPVCNFLGLPVAIVSNLSIVDFA